jgi:hypothetical protein
VRGIWPSCLSAKLIRSTVRRILLLYDLVVDQDLHPQAIECFERERPNEL